MSFPYRIRSTRGLLLFSAVLALPAMCNTANAQLDFGGSSSRGGSPKLEAELVARDGGIVELQLQLSLPAGGTTYSQDPSFSQATKFELTEIDGLEAVADTYTPDHEPKRGYDRLLDQTLEKFTSDVTWSRRFRLRPGAVPESVSIRGTMKHLYCDAAACIPKTHSFAATLSGEALAAVVAATPAELLIGDATSTGAVDEVVYDVEVTPMRGGQEQHVDLQFQITPTDAGPGERVTLSITMTLRDDWHAFDLERGPDQIEKPTEIAIRQVHNLREIGEFVADHSPELQEGKRIFHDQVTFSKEFEVIEAGPHGIRGSVKFQVCKTQCILGDADFTLGVVPVETVAIPPAVGGEDTETPASMITIGAFQLADKASIPATLWLNLVFAFLGGLVLNVMPCVLPVIAVKVLSFVQQAGESRRRILTLNMTYSLGVISVFLFLACLAVVAGLRFGELFQKEEFNLIMAAFVFAMGLSLLGVFEIPVPGMVGSAAGGTHREGLAGAFMTGVFATLLATPCVGPFMGPTLFWSFDQPGHVTLLVWTLMGVGMASPYMVIGAFPRLVEWLPKPGMWMVRFKEFAGFVLMGAVIWIMNFINDRLLIPTLIILVGIALGLWMVGNLYSHAATPRKKWTVRGIALALTAAICAFGWTLQSRENELHWEEFSTTRIEELRDQGTPVLIDFTADWCPICKTNEFIALNRRQTIDFVQEHGVVTIMADYTDESPEIREWLDLCEQESVPLTLIFAKDQPDMAIPLRGLYSQAKLLETLEAAVEGEIAVSEPSAPQTADAESAGPLSAGVIR